MNGLVLHAGAKQATFEQVVGVITPEATETHFPIPHGLMLSTVRAAVEVHGFSVTQEEYGLWQDGQRMFAVWQIMNGVNQPDYNLAIGIRNSHDKYVAAGVAGGSRVFVCDNLSFSGEVFRLRKHTRFILRDIPGVVAKAFGGLKSFAQLQERRFESYRLTEVTDTMVHDLVIKSVDAGALANQAIPKVLAEWRRPTHEEFLPRNAWSLQNAFTEVWKGSNPFDLQARSERLHGLLDMAATAAGNRIVVDEQPVVELLPPDSN